MRKQQDGCHPSLQQMPPGASYRLPPGCHPGPRTVMLWAWRPPPLADHIRDLQAGRLADSHLDHCGQHPGGPPAAGPAGPGAMEGEAPAGRRWEQHPGGLAQARGSRLWALRPVPTFSSPWGPVPPQPPPQNLPATEASASHRGRQLG